MLFVMLVSIPTPKLLPNNIRIAPTKDMSRKYRVNLLQKKKQPTSVFPKTGLEMYVSNLPPFPAAESLFWWGGFCNSKCDSADGEGGESIFKRDYYNTPRVGWFFLTKSIAILSGHVQKWAEIFMIRNMQITGVLMSNLWKFQSFFTFILGAIFSVFPVQSFQTQYLQRQI